MTILQRVVGGIALLVLLLLGIVLWVITWFLNRALFAKRTYMRDPEHIDHE